MKRTLDLHREAKLALTGKWGTFVLMMLLVCIINAVVQIPEQIVQTIATINGKWTVGLICVYVPLLIVTLIIVLMNSIAYQIALLDNARGIKVDIDALLTPFKSFGRYFMASALLFVYICLWTCLFIVPGLIKAFSYALTPYILRDNPQLSPQEAITLSSRMMDGHKLRLFKLYISFLGWFLLSILTCGIGFLWLFPYMKSSEVAFYLDVQAHYEQKSTSEFTPVTD